MRVTYNVGMGALLVEGDDSMFLLGTDDQQRINEFLLRARARMQKAKAHDCDGADCCLPPSVLDELRRHIGYLEDRNAHLREMLTLKSGALVKAKAEIERLERIIGRLVVEKEVG